MKILERFISLFIPVMRYEIIGGCGSGSVSVATGPQGNDGDDCEFLSEVYSKYGSTTYSVIPTTYTDITDMDITLPEGTYIAWFSCTCLHAGVAPDPNGTIYFRLEKVEGGSTTYINSATRRCTLQAAEYRTADFVTEEFIIGNDGAVMTIQAYATTGIANLDITDRTFVITKISN